MKRLALIACVVAVGCAGAARMSSVALSPAAAPSGSAALEVLDHSEFSSSPNGQLSEDQLQKILASPIELDLPSRVGVLPVVTATDWRGPTPDYDTVPDGLAQLVTGLRKDSAFSLVTEMMPIPSGAMGMEALREIAARYRLRYIVLYREVIAKDHYVNPWAWGYVTVIGAFFLPGQHQMVSGYLEASMFDVKTGLFMFTTRRAIAATQTANEWHTDQKLARLAAYTAQKYAPNLAMDFLLDVHRFATAAVAENAKRGADANLVKAP